MSIWKGAQDFVELALSIDQYLPGYVDAYYGPAEIRQALENKEKMQLVELAQVANDLADSIAQDTTLEPSRKEYLQGEVGAMQTTLRLLQGVSIGIIEEVQSLYGLTPQWVDKSIFLEAHKDLEELLPGSEPLADRMQAFRTAFEVKGETPRPIIQRLFKELREQTNQRFSLPEGESCEFEFVTDQPWSAYNWYLGDYKSRIDFNLDLPIRVYNLPHLIAHEGYPGHHSEHAIKEKKLYQDDGRLEHSILPSNTPAAVISEGIAEAALELICSPQEQVDYYQQIIAETNIKGYNGQLIYDITQLYRQSLARVRDNQLLMLHQEAAPDGEVIAYGQRYALTSEKQERQSLKFAKDPLWRSYGFNYNLGYEIISGLLASVDDKDNWFTRLLEEPVTPAQVLRWTEQSQDKTAMNG